MKQSLSGIAARIDRLAGGTLARACGGQHLRLRTSYVFDKQAVEAPYGSLPARCGCGALLEHVHVIHQLDVSEDVYAQ